MSSHATTTQHPGSENLQPWDTESAREAAHRRWQRFRENRAAVEAEAKERAASVIADALERGAVEIAELAVNAESEAVRLQAAKDLLDRFGLKAADKLELTGADGGPLEVARGDMPADRIVDGLREIGLVRAREDAA